MKRLVNRALARHLSTSRRGSIKIVEVGPRDGLQNESQVKLITVQDKVVLVDRLRQSGVTTIELGSLVSPKWVSPSPPSLSPPRWIPC